MRADWALACATAALALFGTAMQARTRGALPSCLPQAAGTVFADVL